VNRKRQVYPEREQVAAYVGRTLSVHGYLARETADHNR